MNPAQYQPSDDDAPPQRFPWGCYLPKRSYSGAILPLRLLIIALPNLVWRPPRELGQFQCACGNPLLHVLIFLLGNHNWVFHNHHNIRQSATRSMG